MMLAIMATQPRCRFTTSTFLLLWVLFAFAFTGEQYRRRNRYSQGADTSHIPPSPNSTLAEEAAVPKSEPRPDDVPISYNLDIAPKVGCEAIVGDLQQRLIIAYAELFKGIRYVNMWGYLETENKGDAAIWTAQQTLLEMMGIETMQVCRFMHTDCDLEKFNKSLNAHKPHSAIVMAGGGNFNDLYWDDQPARIEMVSAYRDVPIRAFPQSVHMTLHERIDKTKDSFKTHPNLQLAARDQPSYDWLSSNLNQEALGESSEEIKSVLLPDIAFMWGSRPDFREKTEKKFDIIILARDDDEVSSADGASSIPFGTGLLDLGGSIGNVSYWKVDWKFTHTPGIDKELPERLKPGLQRDETRPPPEESSEKHTEQEAPEEKSSEPPKENSSEPPKENSSEPSKENSSEPSKERSAEPQNRNPSQPASKKPPPENPKPNLPEAQKEKNSRSLHESDIKDHEAAAALAPRAFSTPTEPEFVSEPEKNPNQRAYAKAIAGFTLLASGRFIVTDRLHGHIMSTIIGVPHVVLDSKLGKNINFHDTWTKDCQCTRVATDFDESLLVARRYFESRYGIEDT